MKKIKGLLLLGILTFLGVGSSFAGSTNTTMLKYNYNNNLVLMFFQNINTQSRYHSHTYYYGGYSPNYFNTNVNNSIGSSTSLGGVNVNYSDGNFVMGYNLYSSNGLDFRLSNQSFFGVNPLSSSILNFSFSSSSFDAYPISFDSNGNYFTFRTDNTLLYNTNDYDFNDIGNLKYCFYGLDFSLSCVFGSGDNYKFKSFYYDTGISDVWSVNDVLIIPFYINNNGNLSSDNTIVLFSDSDELYYNLYDCFSSDFNYLNTCSIIEKGFLNNISLSTFGEYIGNGPLMADFFGFNGKFYLRKFNVNVDDTCTQPLKCTSTYEISFITGNTIPDFVLIPYTGNNYGGGGDVSNFSGSIPFSSLYYQCLGPTYNTPDGNPPAFCLNPDGTLINPDYYKDCFYNTTLSGGELVGHYFCDVGGYIQEMNWVSDGSGGYFAVCSSGDCGNYLVSGPSFIQYGSGISSLSTGLIEDMFTNITGWIAKCPFPYTDFQLGQNFGLIKYFKSIGFNFDPFVLVNCVVAGFSQGRHAITNKAGLSFLTSPLISGDTDQHQALFLFLDFILILGIFGIITFLKKIF